MISGKKWKICRYKKEPKRNFELKNIIIIKKIETGQDQQQDESTMEDI